MTAALDQLLGPLDAMEWPADLGTYLSASRLSLFQKCPEMFRRRYLVGEQERKSHALVWGGADHHAHAVNFAQKIESHEDLPVEDVLDAFRDKFRQEQATGDVEWEDLDPGETLDAGLRLVRAYHVQVSPRVQPLAVEERFNLAIPGLPVPVIGYVDVRGLVDGQRRTIERKTSNRGVSAPKDDWRLQGRVYRCAYDVPFEWHVAVKSATPAVYTPLEKPDLFAEQMNAAMVAATRKLIVNRARDLAATFYEFGPDQPWPDAIEHSYACNYCSFGPTRGNNSCAYWGQP